MRYDNLVTLASQEHLVVLQIIMGEQEGRASSGLVEATAPPLGNANDGNNINDRNGTKI